MALQRTFVVLQHEDGGERVGAPGLYPAVIADKLLAVGVDEIGRRWLELARVETTCGVDYDEAERRAGERPLPCHRRSGLVRPRTRRG